MPSYEAAQAVHVPGHGLVQPGETVDAKKPSPAIRFLLDAGALTASAAPSEPTPPTSPTEGEE